MSNPLIVIPDTHEWENPATCGTDETKARPYWHARMCKEIVDQEPVAAIFIGDHQYLDNVNTGSAACRARYANNRNGPFGILYANCPSYLILGNHEGERSDLAEAANRLAARKLFIPNPTDESNESYYTFVIGLPRDGGGSVSVRIIVIDVNWATTGPISAITDWRYGPTQLAWLRNILDRATESHILILEHHPAGGASIDSVGAIPGFYGRGNMNDNLVGGTDQHERYKLEARFGITANISGHDHIVASGLYGGVRYLKCGKTFRALFPDSEGYAAAFGNIDTGVGVSGVTQYIDQNCYMRISATATGALLFEWVRYTFHWTGNDVFDWAGSTPPASRVPLPFSTGRYWGRRTAVQQSGSSYYVTVPSATRAIAGIYSALEVESFNFHNVPPESNFYTDPSGESNVYDLDFSSSQTVTLNADPVEDYVYVDYVPDVIHSLTARRRGGAPPPERSPFTA